MNTIKSSIYFICICFLAGSAGCSFERESNTNQIETKNTEAQLDKDKETQDEEPIPEEIKKVIEEKKQKRERIISEEREKSSFKDFSNDEVKKYLNNQLHKYKTSCDSTVYNEVFTLMQSDMRMNEFRNDEDEFTEIFADHLFALRDSCNQ